MKATDALALLKSKGTLRSASSGRHSIKTKAVNTPPAMAASRLIAAQNSHSKEIAWMPPSNALHPLP